MAHMSTVLLGNAAPVMADGSHADIGNTITTVELREGWNNAEEAALALTTDNDPVLAQINNFVDADPEYKIAVLEVADLWQYHARAGDLPEWVEADDSKLAQAISDWFSIRGHTCQVGRPDTWTMSEAVKRSLRAAKMPPVIGGGALAWEHFDDAFSEEFRALWREHELLTTVGRDALHSQHLNTAAQPAAFNYMAVSANATAPSAANTTLPGEITTAGGGLLRVQATYAHTASTNTTTLTKTFTANGSDSLPVVLAKIGVLNASSAGTLGYETLLNATATLTVSGDNAAITHTITAG